MPYRSLAAALVLASFMLLVMPHNAAAQGSYTGSKEGFIGSTKKAPPPPLDDVGEEEFNQQVNSLPPSLPPVFDTVATPGSINEDGYAEGAGSDDPCAAYLNDFNGYTVCQDRMQKIEKMRAGKERRKSDYGTTQTTRASEQKRIDAEKAAEEKARAEEEAKNKEEHKESAETKTEEQTDKPEKEKTRLEKYQDQKDDYIKKRPIGVR